MNQTKIIKTKKTQPTEDQSSELLTVREVAHRLRVDETTVRRWIKQGALDAIALPHRGKRQGYRIRKSCLDALLNSNAVARAS